jgi:GNAT superfamily N-acetyltransferase
MIATDEFVRKRTTDVVLRDGTRVRLRPIVPDDKQRLIEGFQRLTPESRYRRFMGAIDTLTDRQLRYLTELDYVDHYAEVAIGIDEPDQPGLGVARYVRLKDEPAVAEAAVAVIDDHHGRGLGTLLLDAIGAVALENGITRFRAFVLQDNKPIRELLTNLGARFSIIDGDLIAEVELPEREREQAGMPIYRVLRAAARGEIGGWRHIQLPRWPHR